MVRELTTMFKFSKITKKSCEGLNEAEFRRDEDIRPAPKFRYLRILASAFPFVFSVLAAYGLGTGSAIEDLAK